MGLTARANAIAFEALFQQWKKPQGPFLEALQRLGVEPARLEASYPLDTLVRAIDVAAQHVFPGLSPSEGRRAVGREYLKGYFETLLGKMLAMLMKLAPGEAGLRRMPQKVMDDYPGVRVVYASDGTGSGLIEVENAPVEFVEFLAGSIEFAMELAGRKAELRIEPRGALSTTVSVRVHRGSDETRALVG